MIVEQAFLQVAPERAADFEADFDRARPIIAASPGFRGLDLHPSVDTPGTYLLLVRWTSIDDHRIGFRGSDRYQQWRALLHPYYDVLPGVFYFKDAIRT